MALGGKFLNKSRTYIASVEANINAQLAARIRDWRTAKRVSQAWVAETLGFDRATMSRLEGGTPMTVSKLILIAQTLEIDLAYLFEGLGEGVLETPVQYAEGAERARDLLQAGQLAKIVQRIGDDKIRKLLVELLAALANRLDKPGDTAP